MQFELQAGLPYNQRVAGDVNHSINAHTLLCGVLGHPIRHSASPAMQNAAMAEMGLNWRYLAFDVHPSQLRSALNGAKIMGWAGLNLTIPHKLLALEMADVIDPEARAWGAVNTIVFEREIAPGQWAPVGQAPADAMGAIRTRGYNTDGDGLTQALKDEFGRPGWQGAAVLILGAGGAARSAALRLAADKPAKLFIVNRTHSSAEELAALVKHHHPEVIVALGLPEGPVDLVINATSLGLQKSDPLPVAAQWLQSHSSARIFDMIYRPAETPLLRAARQAGCPSANGLSMLLYQGAAALRLWSGMNPPVAVMRRALQESIHD